MGQKQIINIIGRITSLVLREMFHQVPVDLVIDHSVQVDVARQENAVQANMEHEFQRNKERFAFLRWGATAFHNMLVVPPGSGIVHQVKLWHHNASEFLMYFMFLLFLGQIFMEGAGIQFKLV